jgi:putative membrane protein
MGDLAQKNGQSDGVKSFGKMLSSDHAAANQKAIEAATGLSMTPPTGPNAKQKADDKMSKMSGPDFDKTFATHMIADHQKDISEYNSRMLLVNTPRQMETLQKHLDTAKSLKSAR